VRTSYTHEQSLSEELAVSRKFSWYTQLLRHFIEPQKLVCRTNFICT